MTAEGAGEALPPEGSSMIHRRAIAGLSKIHRRTIARLSDRPYTDSPQGVGQLKKRKQEVGGKGVAAGVSKVLPFDEPPAHEQDAGALEPSGERGDGKDVLHRESLSRPLGRRVLEGEVVKQFQDVRKDGRVGVDLDANCTR